MNQIMKAANELVAEMERQGRSEAVLYTLDPHDLSIGGGFHILTDAMECLDVLIDIEGGVDMCIGSFTLDQLRVIGAMAK